MVHGSEGDGDGHSDGCGVGRADSERGGVLPPRADQSTNVLQISPAVPRLGHRRAAGSVPAPRDLSGTDPRVDGGSGATAAQAAPGAGPRSRPAVHRVVSATRRAGRGAVTFDDL